jgi:hypothetical protein
LFSDRLRLPLPAPTEQIKCAKGERQARFDLLVFIKAIASLVLEWIFSLS